MVVHSTLYSVLQVKILAPAANKLGFNLRSAIEESNTQRLLPVTPCRSTIEDREFHGQVKLDITVWDGCGPSECHTQCAVKHDAAEPSPFPDLVLDWRKDSGQIT